MLRFKFISSYFCLLTFLSVSLCQNVNGQQIHTYLNNRREDTNRRLFGLIEDNQDFELGVHFQKEQSFSKLDNTKNTKLSIFDNDCVILGGQFYNVVFKNNTFVLNKPLETGISFPQDANLVLVTNYNSSRILLISVVGHCSIYIGNGTTNEWLFLHHIATTHVSDALFFTNSGQLYLIILNSSVNRPDSSKVYKWNGAHFDEIHSILTKNAISVLSFQHKRSEVIIILQKQQYESNLLIFEFAEDKLNMTYTPNNNCSAVVTYSYKNKQYLAVLQDVQSSVLYQWNGIEFVQVGKFRSFNKIKKKVLVYIDNIPIIFLLEQDGLVVFYHYNKNWRLINKSNFSDNIDDVIGFNIMLHNHANAMLMFFKNKDGDVIYKIITFIVRVTKIGGDTQLNEVVRCMLNLKSFLQNSTNYQIRNKTVIHVETETKLKDTVLTSAAHSSGQISEVTITDIEKRIEAVKNRINFVKQKLLDLHKFNSTLTGNLIVNGNLNVNRLDVDKLSIKIINGIEWDPSQWLSYTKSQTINGPVVSKNLVVKNLTVPKHTKRFDGFLLRNGNQNITNKFKLRSLKADNISIEKINDIPFEDVYLRTSPSKIRGTKHFDVLNVNNTNITLLNKENAEETIVQLSTPKSKNVVFSSNLFIKNLNFVKVNDFVWNDFSKSVFRKGIMNRIKGNLSMTSMKCNNLRTQKLGDFNTSSLFTTTTNQNITSVMHWTHILTQSMTCDHINNVRFTDIAFANSIISGPITIDRTHIRGNLTIHCPEDYFAKNGIDHIIGSNVSDLIQKYKKPVKILGNVILENLSVFKGARVIVNGQDFSEDLLNIYWSKNKFQSIPFFEARNGITTSHLTTSILNNNQVSNYLTNDLEDKLPIKWVFKNAVITGSVFLNVSVNHTPDLQILDLVSVKRIGRFNITNKITAQGNVRINNLITNYLDGVKVAEAMNSKTSTTLLEHNAFENLVVKGDIVVNTILTEILNDVHLKDLENTVLYIDRDEHINNLWCNHITTENVNISQMNTNDFNYYIQHLEDLYTITNIDTVKINGKAKMYHAQDVLYVNGYDITKLELKNLDEHVFLKNVKILGTVFADNVEVIYVNNVNFSQLLERVLYRDWDQNITALYTIDHLNTGNIFVPSINDRLVQDLVDIKSTEQQRLVVPGTVFLNLPVFMNSLNCEQMLCNIRRVVTGLQNPSSAYWNTVQVAHNVTLWDSNSHLGTIVNEALHSKEDNIIYSPVTFEHHISAKNIILKKLINDVHLNDIFNDAVLKDVPEQIISGHKAFHKLAVTNAIAEAVYIPLINDIDIRILNESIIDLSNIYNTVITGRKLFYGGLQANRLITNSISNVDPQNLVTLNTNKVISTAYFSNIHIERNLDTEFVNNKKISDFMSQRLLRSTAEEQIVTGTYYMDNVALSGNTQIPFINDVMIDDMVMNEGDQKITAPKYFIDPIHINNDVWVNTLNGQELMLLYNNSVLLGEDNVIDGSIKFSNVSMFANVETEKLNGVTITDIEDYIQSAAPIIQKDVIRNLAETLQDEIKTSVMLARAMSDHYMYLQKSNDLQISTPNISNAYAYMNKVGVMLHLTENEKGSLCGLAPECLCPFQNVLQITNDKSIQTIAEKSCERNFGYETEDITIQLVTNSISTSKVCRTNSSLAFNETASFMWITSSPDGAVNHSYHPTNLSGYISGVEYFSYNKSSYIVITRSYEPINNTHDVPCLVYKISKEKNDVQLVQSIPVESALVLRSFHTVQGVIIVIGTLSATPKESSIVLVYRFDTKKEQFVLLRRIPTNGCTTAAGVVLGPDSLIVIGSKNSSLQVFKYHPKYDNYYFSHNMFTNSSVIALSVFYGSYIGRSDPHLCIVTESGNYYVYSYRYIQEWQMLSSGKLQGLQLLVPFRLDDTQYLFAASNKLSLLLNVVKQGSN